MNVRGSHPLWECGVGPVTFPAAGGWLGAGASEVTE